MQEIPNMVFKLIFSKNFERDYNSIMDVFYNNNNANKFDKAKKYISSSYENKSLWAR